MGLPGSENGLPGIIFLVILFGGGLPLIFFLLAVIIVAFVGRNFISESKLYKLSLQISSIFLILLCFSDFLAGLMIGVVLLLVSILGVFIATFLYSHLVKK